VPTHDCEPRLVTRRRPSRYHTPRSCPVRLAALRRLWALGLTDARVAELLTALTAAALGVLRRDGWTVERAEDLAALDDAPDGPPWTTRQVWYHRHRLGLAARTDGRAAARAELAYRRRRHQADSGWGHLLPSADASSAGVCLRRREVDVLCLLRDAGPMTRRGLCDRMGVRRLRAGGRSVLARLLTLGLVRHECEAGLPAVFALGEAADCPADPAGRPLQYRGGEGEDYG
jgi:hypothetical protein